MGQSRQFRAGQKAPNNGIYIEIGETGSTVNNPKRLKMKAGDAFPENSNRRSYLDISKKTLNHLEATMKSVVFFCVFDSLLTFKLSIKRI